MTAAVRKSSKSGHPLQKKTPATMPEFFLVLQSASLKSLERID
jgi:hypothetical protein